MHFVFFECWLGDFQAELDKLCNYLGIVLSHEAAQHVVRRAGFDRMHRENPDHVRQGQWGAGRGQFSPAQAEVVDEIAGPMLRLLGYPGLEIADGSSSDVLPELPPAPSSAALISAARAARRTPIQVLKEVVRFLIEPRPTGAKIRTLLRYLRRPDQALWRMR
jgi:hypothetical protein